MFWPARHRYTVHYHLALSSLGLSLVVLGLNLWAYYNERIIASEVAFSGGVALVVVLFVTWFAGILLLIRGINPTQRIGFMLFHPTIGSMIPLIYAFGLSTQFQTLTQQPLGDLELTVSFVGVAVIVFQITVALLTLRWRR